jgi:hypothetical protein
MTKTVVGAKSEKEASIGKLHLGLDRRCRMK